MDAIAVFSDTHGNLPALEAVLEDIQKRNIKRIFCLGDFVGKGPNVNETMDLVRKYCELSVLGNWDDFLLYSPIEQMPINWYRNVISDINREYLKSLPRVFDSYFSGRVLRLFHAHPFDVYKRLYSFEKIDSVKEMFKYSPTDDEFSIKKNADIAGYGDIHRALVFSRDDQTLFNTGSTGNPLDDLSAPYVILHGYMDSKEIAPFSIEIVRVPYDSERAALDIENSDMPQKERYLYETRTAKYYGFYKNPNLNKRTL